MSGCLPVFYVFVCIHVVCPLTLSLSMVWYLRCSLWLSSRVQAGPIEACWGLNHVLGILSCISCSVVQQLRQEQLPLIAWYSCSHLSKGEFRYPARCSLGEGMNLQGYYGTSSFARLLAKELARSLNTGKCIWNHSVTLYCFVPVVFSGTRLGFMRFACLINPFL